jgi:hypothetical protein
MWSTSVGIKGNQQALEESVGKTAAVKSPLWMPIKGYPLNKRAMQY